MLKIRELREEAQMTQKQLAEKISNMQRNVSNWEQGVSEPDLQTVEKLADVFGVTLDELFGREQSAVQPETKLISAVRRLSPEQKDALFALIKTFI